MDKSNKKYKEQLERGTEYVTNLLGLGSASQLHFKSEWGMEITRRLGELALAGELYPEIHADSPAHIYREDIMKMAVYGLKGKVDFTL